MRLVEPGKRLLAHGHGILQQVEQARLDIEPHRGRANGRVVIGLPPSVSHTLTGPLVKAFRERLPDAALGVVKGLSTHGLEWLAVGRVDCAVVYIVTPSAAIDPVQVLDEALHLISAPRSPGSGCLVGAPVTLAEAAAQELVIPSRPHSIRMLVASALAAEGRRAGAGLEVERVPAILDLALQDGLHAVPELNAIEAGGNPAAFRGRPRTGYAPVP